MFSVGDPMKRDADHRHVPTPPGILIARSGGVICIAAGFVMGIEGLNRPDTLWLATALAMILTGLLAQGYAFYRNVRKALSGPKQREGGAQKPAEDRDSGAEE